MTTHLPTREQTDAALKDLRTSIKVGDVIEVIQRHVSRSGMMRYLSLRHDGQDITGMVARAMGERCYEHGGFALKVNGAGMDMHFATVYGLGRTLWPEGHPCTGESTGPRRCPSNDHANDWSMLARQYDAEHVDAYNEQNGIHETRTAYVAARSEWINAQPMYVTTRVHSDAGYALTHRTI